MNPLEPASALALLLVVSKSTGHYWPCPCFHMVLSPPCARLLCVALRTNPTPESPGWCQPTTYAIASDCRSHHRMAGRIASGECPPASRRRQPPSVGFCPSIGAPIRVLQTPAQQRREDVSNAWSRGNTGKTGTATLIAQHFRGCAGGTDPARTSDQAGAPSKASRAGCLHPLPEGG